MIHIIVKNVARIISGVEYSPPLKIIGMGPIKKIRLKEFFNPKNKVAKIMIIIPINININPMRNIFINGI